MYFINKIKISCFQCLFPISGIIFCLKTVRFQHRGRFNEGKKHGGRFSKEFWAELFQPVTSLTAGPCPSVSAGTAPGRAEGGNYLIDCKYLPGASTPAQLPRSGRAAAPGMLPLP